MSSPADSEAVARGEAHEAAAETFARRARESLPDAVVELVVFGSTARGEARGLSSDVDVLVVIADDADHEQVDDELHDIAYDVMLEHGPVVELHTFGETEFRTSESQFVDRAVSEGHSYG